MYIRGELVAGEQEKRIKKEIERQHQLRYYASKSNDNTTWRLGEDIHNNWGLLTFEAVGWHASPSGVNARDVFVVSSAGRISVKVGHPANYALLSYNETVHLLGV